MNLIKWPVSLGSMNFSVLYGSIQSASSYVKLLVPSRCLIPIRLRVKLGLGNVANPCFK